VHIGCLADTYDDRIGNTNANAREKAAMGNIAEGDGGPARPVFAGVEAS
jgi:hypothetical protein